MPLVSTARSLRAKSWRISAGSRRLDIVAVDGEDKVQFYGAASLPDSRTDGHVAFISDGTWL
jgi:hypothetical protein